MISPAEPSGSLPHAPRSALSVSGEGETRPGKKGPGRSPAPRDETKQRPRPRFVGPPRCVRQMLRERNDPASLSSCDIRHPVLHGVLQMAQPCTESHRGGGGLRSLLSWGALCLWGKPGLKAFLSRPTKGKARTHRGRTALLCIPKMLLCASRDTSVSYLSGNIPGRYL